MSGVLGAQTRQAAIERVKNPVLGMAGDAPFREGRDRGVDAALAEMRERLLAPDSTERAALRLVNLEREYAGEPPLTAIDVQQGHAYHLAAAELMLRAALGEADT